MSVEIYRNDRVSITRYSKGQDKGYGFQVTWPSSDSSHVFDYVKFDNESDARDFVKLLANRIKGNE